MNFPQRNEDELRHKVEISMREVEISSLKRKLLAAEEMLLTSNNDEVCKSTIL